MPPYGIGDLAKLGAGQKTSFIKDFEKLKKAQANYKFFFVTEMRAFEIMKKRYAREIPGITVVLLPSGDEYAV